MLTSSCVCVDNIHLREGRASNRSDFLVARHRCTGRFFYHGNLFLDLIGNKPRQLRFRSQWKITFLAPSCSALGHAQQCYLSENYRCYTKENRTFIPLGASDSHAGSLFAVVLPHRQGPELQKELIEPAWKLDYGTLIHPHQWERTMIK